MKKSIFLFSLIPLLLAAAPLHGGQVDDCNTMVSTSCAAMRLSICPAGDFEHFVEACGGTSDYIKIEVRDAANNPVPGIPRTDYWLGACDPTYSLCLCCQPVIADAETDIFGVAYLCGPVAGGGCVLNGGIYVMVQGFVILQQPACISPSCLNVVMVSPDLNADCRVNLSDLGIFGASYNVYPPDPCCDYNDDGFCNLSDFAHFAEHYQDECR